MQFPNRSGNIPIFVVSISAALLINLAIALILLKYGYNTLYLFVGVFLFSFFSVLVLPIAAKKIKTLLSKLHWWHVLWLLAFLSGLGFRIRETETIQENPLDFWAIYRIGLMVVVCFVLLSKLSTRRVNWLKSLSGGLIGLLVCYTLVSVISTVWSVYPLWTFYKSVEYLVDLALIAAIVASVRDAGEFKTLFDWNWFLMGLFAVSVWVGVVLWPEKAIRHEVGLIGVQIQGVFPIVAANGVGQLGAMLGIVSFTRLLFPVKYKRFYLVIFLVAMAMLILSQSRSPLTGFLVALPLVLLATKRIGIFLLSSILVIGLFFLTSAGDILWQFFLRGQSTEMLASLTGRVNWWKYGWELLKDRPLIGFGAYAGSRFVVFADLGRTTTSHIHNAWIEVLLGVGFPGLLFVVGTFLGIWIILLRFALYRGNPLVYRLTAESVGVLAVLSVRSMFSSQLIWHPSLTFLLVLGFAEFLRRNYRKGVYKAPSSSHLLPEVKG